MRIRPPWPAGVESCCAETTVASATRCYFGGRVNKCVVG